MLAFGVVCLAFDVDDDPEHASCGGGTVRSHNRPLHETLGGAGADSAAVCVRRAAASR